MIQARYYLNSLINLPLLPLLLYQAKRIRKSVPTLPEAISPQGTVGTGLSKFRLLTIGESTIAGVGVKKHEQAFSGHLAQLLADANDLRVEWRVMAKSGYTAAHVRQKLIPKLEDHSADLLIIGLGGNDTFKLHAPNKWRRDLNLLVDDLQKKFPNKPIVFINLPPVRSFPAFTALAKFVLGRHLDLLHEVLVEISTKRDLVWYSKDRIKLQDWYEHIPGKTLSAQDFFSDGVHPSELTYKTWANEVTKFIQARSILE